jgi:hypothetical protein
MEMSVNILGSVETLTNVTGNLKKESQMEKAIIVNTGDGTSELNSYLEKDWKVKTISPMPSSIGNIQKYSSGACLIILQREG